VWVLPHNTKIQCWARPAKKPLEISRGFYFYAMEYRVAILIDGGFYIQKHKELYLRNHPEAKDVQRLINGILKGLNEKANLPHHLMRSFYYDCKPYTKQIPNPDGKG
jgi:hypothetical protein